MKPWQAFALAFALPLALSPLLLWLFAPRPGAVAPRPRVAVVDIAPVIAEMARYRAAAGGSRRGAEDAVVVRRNLDSMARQQGLLLLVPGAVLAGAEDVTGELRSRLRQAGLLPVAAPVATDAAPP